MYIPKVEEARNSLVTGSAVYWREAGRGELYRGVLKKERQGGRDPEFYFESTEDRRGAHVWAQLSHLLIEVEVRSPTA